MLGKQKGNNSKLQEGKYTCGKAGVFLLTSEEATADGGFATVVSGR